MIRRTSSSIPPMWLNCNDLKAPRGKTRASPERTSLSKNNELWNITKDCDDRHKFSDRLQVNMELYIRRSTMLSVTSQYALRALAQLALQPMEGSMLGKELAEKAEIPANYLAKILLSLKNAGILGTARGSHGGYWLVREPHSIRLIEIVQLFEQAAAPPPCILGQRERCSEDEPCLAHKRWHEIRKAYTDFLEVTTIADLASEDRSAPSMAVALSNTNA
jgi:Rrf2 family protein